MTSSETDDLPAILVVEEEETERAAIAEHLGRAGFSVAEADNSDDALSLLGSRPDLRALVTDAHLPGQLDGSELARAARDRRPDLTVVLMSGHSDLRDDEMPDGVEFISKPYLLDRLVPTLRRLLGVA